MTHADAKKLAVGTAVQVKVSGVLVAGTYDGWNEKYQMPNVKVQGKVVPRKIFQVAAKAVADSPATSVSSVESTSSRVEWHNGHYDIFRGNVKIATLQSSTAGRVGPVEGQVTD